MIKPDFGHEDYLCKILYVNDEEVAIWPLECPARVEVEDQIDEWREIAAHHRQKGGPFEAKMRNEVRSFERDTGALIG